MTTVKKNTIDVTLQADKAFIPVCCRLVLSGSSCRRFCQIEIQEQNREIIDISDTEIGRTLLENRGGCSPNANDR